MVQYCPIWDGFMNIVDFWRHLILFVFLKTFFGYDTSLLSMEHTISQNCK